MIFRRLIACVFIVAACSRTANATSGWDQYSVNVGRYRIAGHIAHGGVWIINPAGVIAEDPAVFADSEDGLAGPPKYVVTQTHLLLIYGYNEPPIDPELRQCFAIRHSDHGVTGPITYSELRDLAGVEIDDYAWESISLPSTTPYFIALVVVPGVALVLFVVVIVVMIRRMRRYSAPDSR